MDKATEDHVALFVELGEVDQITHLRLEHGVPLAEMRDRDSSRRVTNHVRVHLREQEARRKDPCYHGLCGVSRGMHAALVGDHEFTERP